MMDGGCRAISFNARGDGQRRDRRAWTCPDANSDAEKLDVICDPLSIHRPAYVFRWKMQQIRPKRMEMFRMTNWSAWAFALLAAACLLPMNAEAGGEQRSRLGYAVKLCANTSHGIFTTVPDWFTISDCLSFAAEGESPVDSMQTGVDTTSRIGCFHDGHAIWHDPAQIAYMNAFRLYGSHAPRRTRANPCGWQ